MTRNIEKLQAQDVMTENPITVSPWDPLTTAWEIMHRNDIRHLPVVDKDKVCGIISDRDILCELNPIENICKIANNEVEFAMNPRVVTVDNETPLPQLADLMLKHRIHSLVVIDDQRRPLGIVTDYDILEQVNFSANN